MMGMFRRTHGVGWRRSGASFPAVLVLLAAASPALSPAAPPPQAGGAPALTFYPSLQLKFEPGQTGNYFVARIGIVNMSGGPMTDLVLKQTFPKKFKPSLLGDRHHDSASRPQGFEERLEGETMIVRIPELREAEATALAAILTYEGRPTELPFSGIEAEYTIDGARRTEKGPDQSWDLTRYTKYSGSLEEYIKRYASIEMEIPDDDWGFTDLAARLSGRIPTGPVEIESNASGRMLFSIQAGTPGEMRHFMVLKRPLRENQVLKANDEVRRFVMGSVGALAEFTIDGDEMSVRREKVGRFDAWVAETRWYDRVKDRLGEGPARWYILPDEKAQTQWIVTIIAQGRGEGPGKADVPNEPKEKELMTQLEGMVGSMRIL